MEPKSESIVSQLYRFPVPLWTGCWITKTQCCVHEVLVPWGSVMQVHHTVFSVSLKIINTVDMSPEIYSGTEPTYFSYVPKNYGLVTCGLRASAHKTTQHRLYTIQSTRIRILGF